MRRLEGTSSATSFSSASSNASQQRRRESGGSIPSTSSSDHYFLQTKPELAQLLQTTSKYSEALLKHEQNEIDSLAKYIKEIEAVEKNPYEEDFKSESERETLSAAKRKLETSSRKVKECFEKESEESGEESRLPTRCRAVVAEYEKCGQEALEAFVEANRS